MWVPLQLFMAAKGNEPRIFEVSFRPIARELRCDCPGFALRRKCRHAGYVQSCIDMSGGGYCPPMVGRAGLTQDVKLDAEKYREWFYSNTGVLMLGQDGTPIINDEATI
jgi:hypothetical protein